MINGAHAIVYSRDAEALRAFFRDVLELPDVDAGGGWLLFALPPAEMAVHPTDGESGLELYLMCDDVEATVARLRSRGVEFDGDVTEQRWGRLTAIKLPGGGRLGLYEPRHPTALGR
jgi:catechol 2,3-dioxygenase-like lactoylglutathione lyase family enzyme